MEIKKNGITLTLTEVDACAIVYAIGLLQHGVGGFSPLPFTEAILEEAMYNIKEDIIEVMKSPFES